MRSLWTIVSTFVRSLKLSVTVPPLDNILPVWWREDTNMVSMGDYRPKMKTVKFATFIDKLDPVVASRSDGTVKIEINTYYSKICNVQIEITYDKQV